jgi:hypothetical protein
MSICPKMQQSMDALNTFIIQNSLGQNTTLKVVNDTQPQLVIDEEHDKSNLSDVVNVIESLAHHLVNVKAKKEIKKLEKGLDQFKLIINKTKTQESHKFFVKDPSIYNDSFIKIAQVKKILKKQRVSQRVYQVVRSLFNPLLKKGKLNNSTIINPLTDYEVAGDTLIFKKIPTFHHFQKIKTLPQIKALDFSEIKTPLLDSHLIDLKDVFSDHTNIVRVNLHGKNKITSKGVQALQQLKALRELDLSGCSKIEGNEEFTFELFPNLTTLNLANCSQITDVFLKGIDTLKRLEHLDLTSCYKITDEGMAHVIKVEGLKSLYLHLCESIEKEGLISLGQLKNLKKLDIGYCKVTDRLIKELTCLKMLTHLDVTCSTKLTNEGFEQLATFSNLKGLTLFGCSDLSDSDLAKIAELKNLVFLDLGLCTQITDKGLEILKGVKSLKSLKLYGCVNINDKGLKYISSLYNLSDLDLSFLENISDDGISYLRALNKLSTLAVTYCEQVSPSSVQSLKQAKPKLVVT